MHRQYALHTGVCLCHLPPVMWVPATKLCSVLGSYGTVDAYSTPTDSPPLFQRPVHYETLEKDVCDFASCSQLPSTP